MAISFVGFNGDNVINGGNLSIDLTAASPSAPSDGDLCIGLSYVFDRSGNEGRIGNALSYTPLVDNTTGTYRLRVAWKNFVTGDTPVAIEGSGNANDGTVGQVYIFRGHDSSTPFDVTTTETNATSTNPDPPAIVPSSDDCMIVAMSGSSNIDSTPGTVASYTVITGRAANDINPARVNTAYRLLSGGGGASENPAAWSSWSSGVWVSVTAAIRPAGVAAGQPYAKRMGGVGFVQGFRRGQNTNLWRKAGELLIPNKGRLIYG